jgi:hypothetical protein
LFNLKINKDNRLKETFILGRPKQEMLQFYKEMVASIESSKADSNYISDGIKLLL